MLLITHPSRQSCQNTATAPRSVAETKDVPMPGSYKQEAPRGFGGGGCCFGTNRAAVCRHFSAPHPLAEIFSSPRRPAETAAVQVHLMCSSSTALGMEGEADHKEKAAEEERGREKEGGNKFLQLRFGLRCIIIRSCVTIPSLRRLCGEEPRI